MAGASGALGLAGALERERGRWFVWAPVAFGGGISGYFSLATEPPVWVAAAVVVAGMAAVSAASHGFLRLFAVVLLIVSAGFLTAKIRTERVRAPVLAFEMGRADVLGVIELVEPRPKRGERLTLRVVSIKGVAAAETPLRVRVRVMTKADGLQPGNLVRLRATLRPPSPPALPNGYDFARWAWFQGLGATGYAIAAAEVVAERGSETPSLADNLRRRVENLRLAIGERIRATVPGEAGEIAVSLITGERGGITEETNDAYRDSGLVHILSISGLHMVIMAGSVYGAVRLLLALFPAVALRFQTKKWAAFAALLGAAGYLTISGPSIATLRAFLMIAIMFVAVMLDRQALAMRNVAISALVILALMPESLLDPGFQMSFAAVVSLIAAYEAIRARETEAETIGLLRPVAFFLGGIILSTVVASLSVAPIGVYHFHRSQQYALIANLIAVPICNLVVMPAALLTLLLMPIGLEWLPLAVMAWGIEVMTQTAAWVAAMPGAVLHVPEISDAGFALMVLGGLWITLWETRWRLLGVGAVALGAIVAGDTERPDMIAGRGGNLVAVRGADGALNATGPRSAAFDLTRWLDHDGDGRDASAVLKANGFRCDGAGCTKMTGRLRVAVAKHAAALAEDCQRADVLVTPYAAPQGCVAPKLALDRSAFRTHGAHAIYFARDEQSAVIAIARVETVAQSRGLRPWSMPRASRDQRATKRADETPVRRETLDPTDGDDQ